MEELECVILSVAYLNKCVFLEFPNIEIAKHEISVSMWSFQFMTVSWLL